MFKVQPEKALYFSRKVCVYKTSEHRKTGFWRTYLNLGLAFARFAVAFATRSTFLAHQ